MSGIGYSPEIKHVRNDSLKPRTQTSFQESALRFTNPPGSSHNPPGTAPRRSRVKASPPPSPPFVGELLPRHVTGDVTPARQVARQLRLSRWRTPAVFRKRVPSEQITGAIFTSFRPSQFPLQAWTSTACKRTIRTISLDEDIVLENYKPGRTGAVR